MALYICGTDPLEPQSVCPGDSGIDALYRGTVGPADQILIIYKPFLTGSYSFAQLVISFTRQILGSTAERSSSLFSGKTFTFGLLLQL